MIILHAFYFSLSQKFLNVSKNIRFVPFFVRIVRLVIINCNIKQIHLHARTNLLFLLPLLFLFLISITMTNSPSTMLCICFGF